jgi:hypothetical protein
VKRRRSGWPLVVAAVLVAGCAQNDEAGDAITPRTTPDAEHDAITVTDAEYRAEEAGDLPSANTAWVDGVALPAGHVIEVDQSYVAIPDEAPSGPVAWVSDEPVPEIGPLWSDLAARFPETGLWPIVLEPLALDDNRRWWDGELDPTLSRQPDELDGVDFASTLSAWWSDNMPSAEELEDEEFAALLDDSLAPIGRTFPGAAPPLAGEKRPHTTVPGAAGHLGLVPVERPADAPAVMGWTGPINYYNDVGPLTVVLRSWEDRYDAVVVGLGFDTLSMVARRPPQTEDEAAAVAAEHFAVCPDLVWQGTETIEDYASLLRGQVAWGFWWD